MANGNDGKAGKSYNNMNNNKSGMQIGGIVGNNYSEGGNQFVGNVSISDIGEDYEEDYEEEEEYEEDEDWDEDEEDEDWDEDEEDEEDEEEEEVVQVNGQVNNMNNFMSNMVITGNVQGVGSHMTFTNDPNYERKKNLKNRIKNEKKALQIAEDELARTSGIHFIKRNNLKGEIKRHQSYIDSLENELKRLK